MAAADLVVTGTMLTVNDARPTAEALAVTDGRIVAVGGRKDIEALIGPNTRVYDTGEGCVLPGFVEAHGHPLMESIVLSGRMVDIRPVTLTDADAWWICVRKEVAARGAEGAYAVGWDQLLQPGLPEPTLGLAGQRLPGRPAGDRAQLGAQGVLQPRGRPRGRAQPRHPGSRTGRGTAVTPPANWTAPRRRPPRVIPLLARRLRPATTRRCCAPSAPGSTGQG